MKYNLSSDLTRPATIEDFVLMEADSDRIPSLTVSTGVAGAVMSRSTNGLPDSGHPSNSLSSSWTAGKSGMWLNTASCICDAAAGADHGRLASWPSRPTSW
jgi:hypothetical protein